MYLLRLVFKEWWLIIIAIICFIGIFLSYSSISVSCSVDWSDFGKTVVQSIAGGYISGYIFYVFSVLKTKSVKAPPILKLICQQVRYARDEMQEMSYVICGSYDIGSCSFGTMSTEHASYEVCNKNVKFILQAMRNVNVFIEYPMSRVEYLDPVDLNLLSESKQLVTKTIALVMDIMPDNPMYLSEKNSNSIKEIHKNLNQIYEHIKEFE